VVAFLLVFADAGSEASVTVVVVTYRGAAWLPRCLDALAAQRMPDGGRVACWVVDNASTDGTADVLAARTDGVRTIRSAANLGFAGGNNLALREVTTPFAVLLNDDAVPEPGWLGALLAPFADPRVGAVTGKLLLAPRFVGVPLPSGPSGRVGVIRVTLDGADAGAHVVWEPLLAPGA
jgi:GT2 family glycosyltransferase